LASGDGNSLGKQFGGELGLGFLGGDLVGLEDGAGVGRSGGVDGDVVLVA
jgi:hypothetical protein